MPVQVLRASDVETPMRVEVLPPDLVRLRDAFLSGKDLAPQDLQRLIAKSSVSKNGNCYIC